MSVNSTDVIGNWASSDAERIAKAVRAYEQNAGPRSNAKPWGPDAGDEFLAQITGESNTSQGWYSWQKQNTFGGQVIQDPTSVTSFNLSNNVSSQAYSAFAINGESGVRPGTNVWLKFAGFNANNTSCFSFVCPSLECTVTISSRNGSSGGMYNATLDSGTANGASANGATGMTTGGTGNGCLVINAPETSSSNSSSYIITPAKNVAGKIIGRDYAGSTFLPIVSVSVTSLGPC